MPPTDPDLFAFAERATPLPDGIPDEVGVHFERLALQLWNMGRRRYSADAILHVVRFNIDIEQGDRPYRLNNNWTAALARWFLARHPECPNFFELRERRS